MRKGWETTNLNRSLHGSSGVCGFPPLRQRLHRGLRLPFRRKDGAREGSGTVSPCPVLYAFFEEKMRKGWETTNLTLPILDSARARPFWIRQENRCPTFGGQPERLTGKVGKHKSQPAAAWKFWRLWSPALAPGAASRSKASDPAQGRGTGELWHRLSVPRPFRALPGRSLPPLLN
jgi:hypothetical protein